MYLKQFSSYDNIFFFTLYFTVDSFLKKLFPKIYLGENIEELYHWNDNVSIYRAKKTLYSKAAVFCIKQIDLVPRPVRGGGVR